MISQHPVVESGLIVPIKDRTMYSGLYNLIHGIKFLTGFYGYIMPVIQLLYRNKLHLSYQSHCKYKCLFQ